MPSPKPVALPSFSQADRWLRCALGAVAAGFILLFLYTALRRLHYPFSMDEVEGGLYTSVWHVLQGQPLYARPTPDFVPYLYTPLYIYCAAALSKVMGFSYAALRMVSVLATLGSLAVIYAFIFGETRKHLPALAAAGFYAACYHPAEGWFDLARVDSLFIFFFLLAIYCTRRAPILLAVLFWILAFQTKQGVLPIALLIFCAEWRRPARMLLGMGGLIAGLGGSILWLNHATSGWYSYYIFSTTRGLGWLWRQFFFYIPVDFFLPFGIACLLLLAALCITPPALRSRGTHFYLLTSFAVYASIWFLRSHGGSSVNTLMPAYAWTAILFGVALVRLDSWLQSQQGSTYAQTGSLLLISAAIIQLAAHVYHPGRYVPSVLVRQDHQALLDQLHAIPGDIFVFRHNDDELLAGKPLHATVSAFGLITQGPRTPRSAALIADFHQAFDSHRYSALVVDDALLTPEVLEAVGLPADLLQNYPVRIAAAGNDAIDVTSTQPREKWIYLPCSILSQDLSHIVLPGSTISYGNCPNAPSYPAAPSPTATARTRRPTTSLRGERMSLKNSAARLIGRLFPRLWLERELRSRPDHFEPELFLVPLFCEPTKTAIDIGANAGAYSYYMARFAGHVISFEPNLDLWGHLKTILGPHAHLESAALSSQNGSAIFRLDQTNTGVATIEQKNDLSCVADKSIVIERIIETRTLDSFRLSGVTLIKIDTEGHEEGVLLGARQTLLSNRPALIVESEDRHNPGAPDRTISWLAELEYKCFCLQEGLLREFAPGQIRQADPAKPGYMNNFIFLPMEQPALLDKLRVHLHRRQNI